MLQLTGLRLANPARLQAPWFFGLPWANGPYGRWPLPLTSYSRTEYA